MAASGFCPLPTREGERGVGDSTEIPVHRHRSDAGRVLPVAAERGGRPRSSGDRATASGAVCAGSNPAGGTSQEVPKDPATSVSAEDGVFLRGQVLPLGAAVRKGLRPIRGLDRGGIAPGQHQQKAKAPGRVPGPQRIIDSGRRGLARCPARVTELRAIIYEFGEHKAERFRLAGEVPRRRARERAAHRRPALPDLPHRAARPVRRGRARDAPPLRHRPGGAHEDASDHGTGWRSSSEELTARPPRLS